MPTFNHEAASRALEDKGLSVSFVAREIDWNRSTLSLILNGHRKGSVELAVAIARLTGDNPYAFLGPDDPKAAVIDLALRLGVKPADLEATA